VGKQVAVMYNSKSCCNELLFS